MPTYVYKCDQCEYTFEARQRMADDPLTDCPRCEEESVRRVINSVGIVFKGKGFYVTDNRNGKSATVTNGSGTGNETEASGTASESKGTDAGSGSGAQKKTEGSSTEKASTA